MECSKVFIVAYVGLIISTAGFCLTLAGWFAPPISPPVEGVRIAGPCIFIVGTLVLFFSCLMCASVQQRCCTECAHLYADSTEERSFHVQVQPSPPELGQNRPLMHQRAQPPPDARPKTGRKHYSSPGASSRARGNIYSNHVTPNHSRRMPTSGGGGSGGGQLFDTEEETDVDSSTETPSTSPVHQTTYLTNAQAAQMRELLLQAAANVTATDYDPRLYSEGTRISHSTTLSSSTLPSQNLYSTASPTLNPRHQGLASSPQPQLAHPSRKDTGMDTTHLRSWTPPMRTASSSRSPPESRRSPRPGRSRAPVEVHRFYTGTHSEV